MVGKASAAARKVPAGPNTIAAPNSNAVDKKERNGTRRLSALGRCGLNLEVIGVVFFIVFII